MPQTVEQALTEAEFYTDDIDYTLIKLPAAAITLGAGIVAELGNPFAVLLVDKDEVTLLIPQNALEDFESRLHSAQHSSQPYRLITIDVPLEPELTGFIARISTALASAGISILPFAAFTRDHVFVPAQQIDDALLALRKLQAGP